MPTGKGSYGKKVGRPAGKKTKTHMMPDGTIMKGAKHKKGQKR